MTGTIAVPRLKMLSHEQCEIIHHASLEIRRRTGARVYHEDALDLLRQTDAVIPDESLVDFLPGLEDWAAQGGKRLGQRLREKNSAYPGGISTRTPAR